MDIHPFDQIAISKRNSRLECLKLATQKHATSVETVNVARQYSDFVFGTNDAEIVRAARELAEKVDKGE